MALRARVRIISDSSIVSTLVTPFNPNLDERSTAPSPPSVISSLYAPVIVMSSRPLYVIIPVPASTVNLSSSIKAQVAVVNDTGVLFVNCCVHVSIKSYALSFPASSLTTSNSASTTLSS